MSTATVEKKADVAKPVLFRTKKKRYVYWYERPIEKRDPDGRRFTEGGKFIESDNHLLSLDPVEDAAALKALRESPRMEVDFYELSSLDASKGVKATSEMLVTLMAMDRAAICVLFSDMELKGLGLDENAPKEELIAAFMELGKRF